ncbi:hypothetical protein HDV63DRAFT_367628 [Trichoderma sp. SZMC 28014]
MSPAVLFPSRGSDGEDCLFKRLKKEDSGLQCIHAKSAGTTIFDLIIETRGRVSSRVGLMIADWGYKEPDYSLLERRTFRIVECELHENRLDILRICPKFETD